MLEHEDESTEIKRKWSNIKLWLSFFDVFVRDRPKADFPFWFENAGKKWIRPFETFVQQSFEWLKLKNDLIKKTNKKQWKINMEIDERMNNRRRKEIN